MIISVKLANASDCSCTIPCLVNHYESSVSYASTSTKTTVNEFIHSKYGKVVAQKYAYAQEVRQRVDPNIIEEDTKHIEAFNDTYSTIMDTMQSIRYILNSLQSAVEHFSDAIAPKAIFHLDVALDSVKYIIHHDFIRGYDVMDERTLIHVTTGFYQLQQAFSNMLDTVTSNTSTYSTKDAVYLIIIKDLDYKANLAMRAYDNFTEIFEAYTNGTPILTYRKSYDRRYDMDFVSLELLSAVQKDHEGYHTLLMSELDKYLTSLDILKQLASDAYTNQTYDTDLYNQAISMFQSASRGYNFRKYLIKDRIIHNPEELIDNRIKHFNAFNLTFLEQVHGLKATSLSIENLINQYTMTSLQYTQQCLDESLNYLKNQTNLKKYIADCIVSKNMDIAIQNTSNLFKDLRLRGQQMNDIWNNIGETCINIWQTMISESTTQTFYAALSRDINTFENTSNPSTRYYLAKGFNFWLKMGSRNVNSTDATTLKKMLNADFVEIDMIVLQSKLQNEFASLGETFNILDLISPIDGDLAKAVRDLQRSLEKFRRSQVIDAQFMQ